MRIWGEISKITEIYTKQKKVNRTEKTEQVTGKKDTLSISSEAKDHQLVMQALKGVPDIRRDKVDTVTDKLRTGTYTVSGRETADKLINNILDKKI